MSRTKKSNSTFKILFFGLFGFVGLVFVLASFFIKSSDARFFATARPVQARIVDFNTTSNDNAYTVVAFSANGRNYRARLSFYSSSMRIGAPIEVYYRPDNPIDVRSTSGSAFGFWIFFSLGSVFLLICITGIVVSARMSCSRRRLLREGTAVRAAVLGMTEITGVTVNGRHPLRLHCRGELPDGSSGEFKSRNVWHTPEELSDLGEVNVYVDPANPKRYYVDVEGTLKTQRQA